MYSSIVKKKCKCGCNRFPTISCAGYNYVCAPEEMKEKLGTRRKLNKKNKRIRVGIATKLHQVQNQSEQDDKVLKEKWFALVRKQLTGTCQCGCGNKSSKGDYKDLDGKIVSQFRSSICHIFPKRDFHSIKYHPLNYVERAFWGGCHTNMDNQSMDKWVGMADWDDIKAKFYELAPLLTDEERSLKFYSHLERLVYSN